MQSSGFCPGEMCGEATIRPSEVGCRSSWFVLDFSARMKTLEGVV